MKLLILSLFTSCSFCRQTTSGVLIYKEVSPKFTVLYLKQKDGVKMVRVFTYREWEIGRYYRVK
jgi:hypothetical protein